MANAIRSLLTTAFLSAFTWNLNCALAATPAPARGELLGAPQKVGSYTVSALLSSLSDGWLTQELLKRVFAPVCSVTAYHFQYETVGGHGEATTASAALMIPSGVDARCRGPRPIVLYAHGQRDLRFNDISNLDSASNYEGLLLAVSCAAHGYITVAPNYAGYDTSTLTYHPYLNADQQSKDMIDALTAAHSLLQSLNLVANGKLFVTGYSQGGHVAMATHRALQMAGIPVTASVPMSGPYAMSAFGDAVFMGRVDAGAVDQFVMLASSYQFSYGNLYGVPTQVFEAKYASGIESRLPSTVGVDTLIAAGLLPPSALFNDVPPAAGLAAITPARTPVNLAAIFAAGFGADNLVTNAYRLEYLEDAATAPDGGYPNTTTALPPVGPHNMLRIDLKSNDLRNWVPTAPVLLCGGNEDPVVFFLNTQLMQAYWAAYAAPETPVAYLDVDSKGGPYEYIKAGFRATKDLIELTAILDGASDGGRAALLSQYHTILVPAFCVQAARAFFDAH